MATRSWIRNLFAHTPRTVRKAAPRCRPAFEAIEDRLAPAVITVTSPADGALASLAGDGRISLREAIEAANTKSP